MPLYYQSPPTTRWINRARVITCKKHMSWSVRVVMELSQLCNAHPCGVRAANGRVTINTHCQPTRNVFFSLKLRPARISPFSTYSLSRIHIVGRRDGPLRSFRSRSPCLLETCCWPDHGCTCCQYPPDIPSNTPGLRDLPLLCLSARFLEIIRRFSSLTIFTLSLHKFTPIQLSAGHNSATTGAIQLPRTRTHCARPYSSTTLPVPSIRNPLRIRNSIYYYYYY
jgi:hypothetical protein